MIVRAIRTLVVTFSGFPCHHRSPRALRCLYLIPMSQVSQSAMIGKRRSVLGTPIDVPLILTGLTVFGMALAIFSFLPLNDHTSRILSFIGISLVYLAGGLPASSRALTALWKERALDIDLLMVVAAVAAAAVGAPFEGAVLLTLFSVSTTLEKRALGRARRAIEALMALRPETALRKSVDGTVAEIPASGLSVNDIVVLRPGARVPADGVIVSGYTSIDEASITGESMPVAKDVGAPVFEATVNLDGVVEVVVTKTVAESTVARMISLVTQAQAAKAPSERFSAWFGQRYTIGVMVSAILAFAGFYWVGRDWEHALLQRRFLRVRPLCDSGRRAAAERLGLLHRLRRGQTLDRAQEGRHRRIHLEVGRLPFSGARGGV